MDKRKTRVAENKIMNSSNLKRKFYAGSVYTARLRYNWRHLEDILRKTDDCSLPGITASRRYLLRLEDYKF